LSDSSFTARVKHYVGLDRAISFTILGRFWTAAASFLTLLLIAHFLSPNEQGYYYTFNSLAALQIVFELGFSFVILQLAAHERASLTFLPNGRIEGNPIAHSRLASVLQKAVKWYFVAGVLMAVALIPAGQYFFAHLRTQDPGVRWNLPWCLLVFATMLAFQIDPLFSFLEGCGFVEQVAHRRLVQAILGSFLAWGALFTHHGLYAPCLIILGQVAVGVAFLLSGNHRPMLKDLLLFPVREHYVAWRTEIWSFQWKIAVSWLCGYFIYQIFSPVLMAFQGPVAAGQMGMSLSITAGIGSVALAWMSTKASPFGAMIARGQFAELDKLFFRTLWQSTLLLVFGASTFLLVLIVGGQRYPKLAMRILPPWVVAILLILTIMNHVICSLALYLRAHKREPFFLQAVISAILIAGLTFVLGKYYGANAVVVGLLLQSIVFGWPSATYIFVTKRRQWHGNVSQPPTALSVEEA